MVTNGVKSLWVEVTTNQLKNSNATECAEGELKKQGAQDNNQLKTPTVTACYNRRSVNRNGQNTNKQQVF